MKLTSDPKFTGKLVAAWQEPCYRVEAETHPIEMKETRFRFVVDEMDNEIATVSDRYTLVQNRDLISAFDLAAEELGIRLEVEQAEYHNGQSFYKLRLPDYTFKAKGDTSKTEATVDVRNDYRGNGGLKALFGWFRLVCTNGMVIGEVVKMNAKKHVGQIDLMEFARSGLKKIVARYEAEKLIADTLIDIEAPGFYPRSQEDAKEALKDKELAEDKRLVLSILADTPNRYHNDLEKALGDYRRELGDNLYSMVQAITDISSHRMQMRANGEDRTHFNTSADDWATRQIARIRKYAEVE